NAPGAVAVWRVGCLRFALRVSFRADHADADESRSTDGNLVGPWLVIAFALRCILGGRLAAGSIREAAQTLAQPYVDGKAYQQRNILLCTDVDPDSGGAARSRTEGYPLHAAGYILRVLCGAHRPDPISPATRRRNCAAPGAGHGIFD